MKTLSFITHHALILMIFSILLVPHTESIAQVTLPLDLNLPHDISWQKDAMQANNTINHFIEPNDDINYADYHYVGTHNGHVYPEFFRVVYQQDQTTLSQLAYGIRGFMWDTYNFTPSMFRNINGPQTSKICLSHGKPGLIALTQKGCSLYQSLQYELRRLIEFMKYSPNAVITIILENYADMQQTADEIENVIKSASYDPVLKPSDWHNSITNQRWPTLGWMRKQNKRLVIFTQSGDNTEYTWQQFPYCIENKYSTIHENDLYKERDESHKYAHLHRNLVIFNNFKATLVTRSLKDTKKQLHYDAARYIITHCQGKNFAHKKLFNGYFADRIIDSCNDLYKNGEKTIFEYVNEINDGGYVSPHH